MTEMTDTTATPRGERTREATDRKLMRATLQIAVDRGNQRRDHRGGGPALPVWPKPRFTDRYHNADELLHEISAMYLAIPDSDPVPSPTREHFTQLLQRLVDWVRDNDIDVKRVGIVLSSEAEFFQHIVDQVVTPWLERVGAFLKQGVAQGVFREDVDEKLLLSTIIGSLVAYEAIEGKAMDDDTAWASRMADLLWPALLK